MHRVNVKKSVFRTLLRCIFERFFKVFSAVFLADTECCRVSFCQGLASLICPRLRRHQPLEAQCSAVATKTETVRSLRVVMVICQGPGCHRNHPPALQKRRKAAKRAARDAFITNAARVILVLFQPLQILLFLSLLRMLFLQGLSQALSILLRH